MSSETSINTPSDDRSDALQPWQLFTLAGLIGATIVVFMSRGQTPAGIILLSLIIFAAAYVGLAALRTFLPLAGIVTDTGPEVLGGRTRAALEREKTLLLRSIKELEFDRGMGKVSEKDFAEMSARLRARAARLMRQLDAGSLYRQQIEREVERRLRESFESPSADAGARVASAEPPARDPGTAVVNPESPGAESPIPDSPPQAVPAPAACASCGTLNDPDARFCKSCGTRVGQGA